MNSSALVGVTCRGSCRVLFFSDFQLFPPSLLHATPPGFQVENIHHIPKEKLYLQPSSIITHFIRISDCCLTSRKVSSSQSSCLSLPAALPSSNIRLVSTTCLALASPFFPRRFCTSQHICGRWRDKITFVTWRVSIAPKAFRCYT